MTNIINNNKNIYPIFSDPTIHSTGKTLYWFMVMNGAKNKDKKFFYSKRTIGESLNKSTKTIERHLKILEREGYIRIINRYRTDGGKSTNLYEILK